MVIAYELPFCFICDALLKSFKALHFVSLDRAMKITSNFIDIFLSLKVDKSSFLDILCWYDIYKSIIQTYKNEYCHHHILIFGILQLQSIL